MSDFPFDDIIIGAGLATVLSVVWFQWLVAAGRSVPMVDATLIVANRVSQTIKNGGGTLVLHTAVS